MRQLEKNSVAAGEPIGHGSGVFHCATPGNRDGSAHAPATPGIVPWTARESGRGNAWLRACRFYLMSLLYGAAVYGFVVAYLLALGAMTEPMPTYYAIR